MRPTRLELFRAAERLRHQYERRRERALQLMQHECSLPIGQVLDALRADEKRLELAASRRFDHAWHRCAARHRRRLEEATRLLNSRSVALARPIPAAPSTRFLCHELEASAREFELRVNGSDGLIAARTEPITLWGITLGPFDIVLEAEPPPGSEPSSWYTVDAVAPNPAACNEAVTHPHVEHERLCAGEAAASIAEALRSGRLLDFFLLVASILRTYNPSSPYVALEQWHGVRCEDCGWVEHPEHAEACQCCDLMYCGECVRECADCGLVGCRGCMIAGELSNNWLCDGCAVRCERCDRYGSGEDLAGDFCHNCNEEMNHESHTNEHGHDSPHAHGPAGRPEPAPRAEGVGQAAVPLPPRGQ